MRVIRIVPNLRMNSNEASRGFYAGFLGLDVGMDMEWIVTFVSAADPTAQLSTLTEDATAPIVPNVSVEVDDVDGLYAEALRRGLAVDIPADYRTVGRAALLRSGSRRERDKLHDALITLPRLRVLHCTDYM